MYEIEVALQHNNWLWPSLFGQNNITSIRKTSFERACR